MTYEEALRLMQANGPMYQQQNNGNAFNYEGGSAPQATQSVMPGVTPIDPANPAAGYIMDRGNGEVTVGIPRPGGGVDETYYGADGSVQAQRYNPQAQGALQQLGTAAAVLGGGALLGAVAAPALLGAGGVAGGAAGLGAAEAGAAGAGLASPTFGAGVSTMPTTIGAGGGFLGPGGAAAGGGALSAGEILAGGGTVAGGLGAGGFGLPSSLWAAAPYVAQGVGAAVGASAARDAAGVQADAANRAADSTLAATRESNTLLRDMFNTNRADLAPYREAGTTALSALTAGTAPGGQFTQRFDASRMMDDPGYQFRLTQGLGALDRIGAARGSLLSGRTGRESTRYAQDYASNEYGNAYGRFNTDQTNAYNRLASLAGIGQQATNTTAQAGQNTASQIGQNTIAGANNAGNLQTSAAAARASGYVGGANAMTNLISQGTNYAQSSRLMDLLSRQA